MLLLFFLMVAMGGLMVIWIMFPGAGVKLPDPLPPRPQTVIVAPQAAEAAAAAAPEVPAAASQRSANDFTPETPAAVVSGIEDLPTVAPATCAASLPGTPAGNPGAQPAPIDLDELRRTLEQLVGNPPPPTRP